MAPFLESLEVKFNYFEASSDEWMNICIITQLVQNLCNYLAWYGGKHLQKYGGLTLNLLNFLNGIIHLTCVHLALQLSIIIFRDIKMRTWKLVYQQYKAWSDCQDVQAGLALCWWQRLIIFGSIRIRYQQSKHILYCTYLLLFLC